MNIEPGPFNRGAYCRSLILSAVVYFSLSAPVSSNAINTPNHRPTIVARTDCAKVRRPKLSPQQVVAGYLEMAARGAHFTDEGRSNLGCFAYGPPENTEIVFTTVVVTGYRIEKTEVVNNSATVKVRFQNVGSMIEDFYKFVPRVKATDMKVVLRQDHRREWRIINPPGPYMLTSTVTDHLRDIEKTAANPRYFENVRKQVTDAADNAQQQRH